MARKRIISPEIWQSEDFAKLPMLGKIIFIGMFSHADDEGRGRAKAAYIKSILFPYERGMRVGDVDKALNEIARHMSVVFYRIDGNEYYQLVNWRVWQRLDKPQKSKLPSCDDEVEWIRIGDKTTISKRPAHAPKKVAGSEEHAWADIGTKQDAICMSADVPGEAHSANADYLPNDGATEPKMLGNQLRGRVQKGMAFALTEADIVTASADEHSVAITYQSEEEAHLPGEDGALNAKSDDRSQTVRRAICDGSKSVQRTGAPKKMEGNTIQTKGTDTAPNHEGLENDPVCISLPLCDGTHYPIREGQRERWEQLYPAVDIMQELRKMAGWCDASPKKRKSKSGILRFVNGWLAREQDKGGAQAVKNADKPRNPALRYPQREIDPNDDCGIRWI